MSKGKSITFAVGDKVTSSKHILTTGVILREKVDLGNGHTKRLVSFVCGEDLIKLWALEKDLAHFVEAK